MPETRRPFWTAPYPQDSSKPGHITTSPKTLMSRPNAAKRQTFASNEHTKGPQESQQSSPEHKAELFNVINALFHRLSTRRSSHEEMYGPKVIDNYGGLVTIERGCCQLEMFHVAEQDGQVAVFDGKGTALLLVEAVEG